jgi:hypothetical protein
MGSPYNDFAEERDQGEMSEKPHVNKQCVHCKTWSPIKYWDHFKACSYCGHKNSK